MKKRYGAVLTLLLGLPLIWGCDSGAVGTAVATMVPTSVSGAAAAMATALPTAMSGAATAMAPTVNSVGNAAAGTATALAPTIDAAGNAALATASALAPTVSSAATAVTTAVSGSLSTTDAAYLTKVNGLATQMANSPELSGVVQALTGAAASAATGGTVDTAGLTDKVSKATTFMNGIATQANALQPTANMQSVQTELMKAVNDWTAALPAAQTAVGAQNWTDAAKVAAQMAQGASDLATLTADLAARGVK